MEDPSFGESEKSFVSDHANNSASCLSDCGSHLGEWLLPNTPGVTFRRKLMNVRTNSTVGNIWDSIQLVCIVICCLLYFSSSYSTVTLDGALTIFYLQLIITLVFLLDFVLNWYLMHDAARFMLDGMTYLDILTMIPTFMHLGMKPDRFKPEIYALQCFRILRISRILRTWKYTATLSSVGRQITELVLTLVYLVFLAATIVHLMEGAVLQLGYNCKYSTEKTLWRPSCVPDFPSTPTCDCKIYSCFSVYTIYDFLNKPSLVSCQNISFFEAIYFIIITTFSVGYGDITATSTASKAVVILYILTSLVIFPMRISELQRLLTNASPYLVQYVGLNNQTHIIITGATSDKKKLEHILKEIFHPDRTSASKEDLHVVILAPSVPSEEVRSLIGSNAFQSKVTWLIGNALSVSDLKKARADTALAMFFLCNSNTTTSVAPSEDASIVLQALSVTNFNMELECLVQVLRPESSKSFIESDVSVVLCLDEFKTIVQARNAAVPGFSTVVENLFHSFGSIEPDIRNSLPLWYHEYLRGAGMELYFTDIPLSFIRLMRFSFKRIATAILLEFDCITLGVSNAELGGVVFNPNNNDMVEFGDVVEFYSKNRNFLIMADDQQQANSISESLEDLDTVERILQRLSDQELLVPCGIGKPAWASAAKYSRNRTTKRLKPENRSVTRKGQFRIISNFGFGHRKGNDEESDDEHDDNSDSQGSGSSESSDSEFTQCDDSDDSDTNEATYIGFKKMEFGGQSRLLYDDDDDNFNFASTVRPPTASPTSVTSKSKKVGVAALRNALQKRKKREISDSSSEENEDYFGSPELSELDMATSRVLPSKVGLPSAEIREAQNIRNHIVVSGCDENLQMFVSELRRPAVVGNLYHPIIIVAEEAPRRWSYIKERYNDVYFHKGSMADRATLHLINAKDAFSLTLLAARNEVLKVDDQHVNPGTLLVYLAIESNIPKHVHISVELSTPVNIAVMNATIVRRERNYNPKQVINAASKDEISNKLFGAGTFTTRKKSVQDRKSVSILPSQAIVTGRHDSEHDVSAVKLAHSFGSSVEKIITEAREVVKHYNDQISGAGIEKFWDAMDSHHVLPVFASGTAYIPSCFESLLVSNWYSKITPVLCEKFIVGQGSQSFALVPIPKELVGRLFMDIFRVFLSNGVLCIGIFRAPQGQAVLPYVFLSPPSEAKFAQKDSVYVFGTQKAVTRAVQASRSTFIGI